MDCLHVWRRSSLAGLRRVRSATGEALQSRRRVVMPPVSRTYVREHNDWSPSPAPPRAGEEDPGAARRLSLSTGGVSAEASGHVAASVRPLRRWTLEAERDFLAVSAAEVNAVKERALTLLAAVSER